MLILIARWKRHIGFKPGVALLATTAFCTLLWAQANVAHPDQDVTDMLSFTAEAAGVLAPLNQLKAEQPETLRSLLLQQRISQRILAASLEVDAAVAQIDTEIARTHEVEGYLQDRRDTSVNRSNLLAIVLGGALGATSSGLQLSRNQAKAAAATGIAAGVVSGSFGVLGIRAQKGGTRVLDIDSNMLARFFDRPGIADRDYPALVWRFLNQVAPTDKRHATRKEQLIQTWVTLGRIDPPDTLTGKLKIERVASSPSMHLPLTIDDLGDRAAMLEDVRAKISFFKRDLATLLRSLDSINTPEPQ